MKNLVHILAFAVTIIPIIILFISPWYLQIIETIFYSIIAGIGIYFYRSVPATQQLNRQCLLWIRRPLPPVTPLTSFGEAFTLMLLNNIQQSPVYEKEISKNNNNSKKIFNIYIYNYIVFKIAKVILHTENKIENKIENKLYFMAIAITDQCMRI